MGWASEAVVGAGIRPATKRQAALLRVILVCLQL